MTPNPQQIADSLAQVIALLRAHGEERWSVAFERVEEHVQVALGAADPRSTARVVRDLLHMFRGGLGPFAGLRLESEGRFDERATAQLALLWDRLQGRVAEQLSRSPL